MENPLLPIEAPRKSLALNYLRINPKRPLQRTFPGWPVIAISLPLFGLVIALFLVGAAPRPPESFWFPPELGTGLRILHSASILGFIFAIVGLIRWGNRGLLARFAPLAYVVVSVVVLLVNFGIAVFLLPVWTVH